ncbi:sugar phosphate isomerase/epimerase family protein [Streptomyces sp. OE57]|uniref:sugar phosphate isomerase/epimerase family protein n=1 Tax=Streptomyces lacaronensis TaxID=3379885 RepID=UPI0039B74C93
MCWIKTASTICFKPYSLEEAVQGIAEAGFTNVELSAVKGNVEHLDPDDLSPSAVRRAEGLLERHGMRAVSVSGHGDVHTAEGLARHRRILRATQDVGARVLISFIDGVDGPEAWAAFKTNILCLADEARELGVGLCLENHSHRMATAEKAARLISAIGHPWIRMNYDTGNASFLAGACPEDDVTAALPILGHVHLKDHQGGPGNMWFPPLGDGDLHVDAFLSRIESAGFEEPVSVEIAFDANWPAWNECLAALKRSKEFLDSTRP